MAHVTSVRAVHAQPAPVVSAKSYEPPFASTDRGRLSAAMPHPDGAGDGDGDGDGAGLGDGLGLGDGPVGVAPVDPHPATAIASTHGAQRSSTRMMARPQQSPRQARRRHPRAHGQVPRMLAFSRISSGSPGRVRRNRISPGTGGPLRFAQAEVRRISTPRTNALRKTPHRNRPAADCRSRTRVVSLMPASHRWISGSRDLRAIGDYARRRVRRSGRPARRSDQSDALRSRRASFVILALICA